MHLKCSHPSSVFHSSYPSISNTAEDDEESPNLFKSNEQGRPRLNILHAPVAIPFKWAYDFELCTQRIEEDNNNL